MKYDIAIFDMCGTVFDTYEDYTSALEEVFKNNNLPVPTMKDVKSFGGRGVTNIIKGLLPNITEHDMHKCINDFSQCYRRRCNERILVYPEAKAVLSELKRSSCRAVILSDRDETVMRSLCRRYIGGLAKLIVTQTYDINGREDNNALETAINAFALSRKNAVYIGDTEYDMERAKSFGMDHICVSWGLRTEEELRAKGVKNIATDAAALIRMLKGE